MANTFPSSGNAGIGTTSPENLLTIDTGGNTVPAIARIIRCLSLGYRGPYNGRDVAEAAFIQAERPGVEYPPIEIQPLGGVVFIGHETGLGPPDVDQNGNPYKHRFVVNQEINNVADPSVGEHIMATFEMVSTIPAGDPKRDVGCGRFVVNQRAGGAWVRGLEAHAVRLAEAANARTWGLEVGVHNAKRDPELHVSVGIYVHAANPSFAAGAQRANTGILIDGRPGGDGDGWDDFIRCRSGSLGGSTSPRFWVGRAGNVWANSNIEGNGNLLITGTIRGQSTLTITGAITGQSTLDITGNIMGSADIAAMNTVQAGAEMYATAFITTSSQTLKENIVPLDTSEAVTLLGQLTAVRYNFKDKPDRQLMGFVAEDVPPAFAVNGRGVDVMAVVATLAAVVRAQREALTQLQARVDALEAGGGTP